MPLPTCQCFTSFTQKAKLDAIYCALLEISEAGGGDSGSSFILGEIRYLSGPTVPALWITATGQAVSRATYADYFALVGTTYGAGNGTTTFNVPDLRARACVAPDGGANRLTNQGGGGMNGGTAGSAGGEETHSLSGSEIAGNVQAGGDIAAGTDFATDVLGGSSDPHNNVQPTLIVGAAIIYVGV
jgi:microcystin-dependent protein